MRSRVLPFLLMGILALALVGWFVMGAFHTRHKEQTDAEIGSVNESTSPSDTGPSSSKTSVFTQVAASVQKLIQPASTPNPALEKAKASEQFGEALQRAGIETQPEASH